MSKTAICLLMEDFLRFPEKYTQHICGQYISCAVCRQSEYLVHGVCEECWCLVGNVSRPLVAVSEDDGYDELIWWDDDIFYDEIIWDEKMTFEF